MWLFFSRGPAQWQCRIQMCPHHPREESNPRKGLWGRAGEEEDGGAVNLISLFSAFTQVVSNSELALYCKNLWESRLKPLHPTNHPPAHPPPCAWAERIGVNQQSDLRWETLKRRKKGGPPPSTSLTNQRALHLRGHPFISHAKANQTTSSRSKTWARCFVRTLRE